MTLIRAEQGRAVRNIIDAMIADLNAADCDEVRDYYFAAIGALASKALKLGYLPRYYVQALDVSLSKIAEPTEEERVAHYADMAADEAAIEDAERRFAYTER